METLHMWKFRSETRLHGDMPKLDTVTTNTNVETYDTCVLMVSHVPTRKVYTHLTYLGRSRVFLYKDRTIKCITKSHCCYGFMGWTSPNRVCNLASYRFQKAGLATFTNTASTTSLPSHATLARRSINEVISDV